MITRTERQRDIKINKNSKKTDIKFDTKIERWTIITQLNFNKRQKERNTFY
jgi:hypothetical protein